MGNFLPPPDRTIRNHLTDCGFIFGAAEVTRMVALTNGAACLRIETPKLALNIRVTRTGKMRVTLDNGMEVICTK